MRLPTARPRPSPCPGLAWSLKASQDAQCHGQRSGVADQALPGVQGDDAAQDALREDLGRRQDEVVPGVLGLREVRLAEPHRPPQLQAGTRFFPASHRARHRGRQRPAGRTPRPGRADHGAEEHADAGRPSRLQLRRRDGPRVPEGAWGCGGAAKGSDGKGA